MTFNYPAHYPTVTKSILDGLIDKGLTDAHSIHQAMVQEFEAEVSASYDALRELVISDVRAAVNQFFEQGILPATVEQETRQVLEQGEKRAREVLLLTLGYVEDSFARDPLPLDVPFLMAVDLLFQASVLRLRLFKASDATVRQSLGIPLLFVNSEGLPVYDGPPVRDEAEEMFQLLLSQVEQYIREIRPGLESSARRATSGESRASLNRIQESAIRFAEKLTQRWRVAA